MAKTPILALLVVTAGCDFELEMMGPRGREDGGGGIRLNDGGMPLPGEDGGGGPPPPPGTDAGGGVPGDTNVDMPTGGRPVDIMPPGDLAGVAGRMPQVGDAWLLGVLESADTMWYDRHSIVPGYQDSHGDGVTFPVGMRPNTIDPGLIVAGGHEMAFQDIGTFHFPFGTPARSSADVLYAVDFFQLPRDGSGNILPVVYWRHDSSFTHRVEWMFPVGTIFGEILFIVDSGGQRWPFEIRVRVREATRYRVDVFRPFPAAPDLAAALEAKRGERAEWASAADITALIDHCRNPATLTRGTLSPTNFESAFPSISLAEDELPGLSDDTILRELLMETPFRSARGAVWKESGGMRTYAATTSARFQIVPRDYAGGFLSVDEETCETCHRDAGRQLETWYFFITLYGELWGADDTFTWHPFDTDSFVDSRGEVVSFNDDNRYIRSDFEAGGIVEEYSSSRHGAPAYVEIRRSWRPFDYE